MTRDRDAGERLPLVLLIESVLNETAQEHELKQLSEIISNDADARKLYLDYCEMHCALMFQIQSAQATEAAMSRLNEAKDEANEGGPGPSLTSDHNPDPRHTTGIPNLFSFIVSPIPLTAIVTAILVTGLHLLSVSLNGWMYPTAISGLKSGELDKPTQVVDVDSSRTAATLTGMVDCVWKDQTRQPEIAAPLRYGSSFALESGLMQVTFESGAKMIVEGPAEFTLVSNMEAEFQVGRMTSYCPPSAHGFTVQTPEATVVDLGTEFGVDVSANGSTEVHVFSGEVVSWNKKIKGPQGDSRVHLKKNNTATFDAGQTMKVVEVDLEKYVRSIDERLDEAELPALPIKRDLALWLAADTQVKTDHSKKVVVWQDLVAGDNQHFDNAWQYVGLWRPKWVEQSIGGRPAVRFNGRSSYLMTTPMETTNEQTVFIVFSFGDGASRRLNGGQLLNYNGPPHRYLMRSGSAGVLQIGDLASTKNDFQRPGFLRGHVFSGFRNGHPVDAGEIYSNSVIEENKGTLCVYRYSHSRGESELLINGDSQAVTSAPTPIAVTSRKVIGRHGAQNFFFYGDISEMLIFNDALSAEEIAEVSNYLANRYSLELKGN